MKCPACCSEIDDHSYRCRECLGICSYRRVCWRYRYIVFGIVALIGFWTIKGYVRQRYANDYYKLPEGALVSDATTLSWLGLRDKGWFCEEPHYKGRLLHLRHKVFQPKDVIIFIHGFIGDYVHTWGKPKVLLDDPRFNRNYDFVFYGFKTALYGDVPVFDEEAAKLDRMLTHLEEDYKSITIVTHSKGGLLAMRTLLNRAKDFPSKQPYKIHRIVMFTPLTENVSLAGQAELVKLLAKQSTDIAQMQANTYSELGRVKEDLKALLDAQDPLAGARKEAFMKDVAEHLYIINAERDEVVDVGPNGEQIRQTTNDRIDNTVFEMNKFVVDKNPMVGLAWRNICDAVQAKFRDVPEPARQKQIEDFTKQTYYVYIFLDLYARMDDLRSRGIMSPNDEMIVEWKHDWLPNLMGSEIGKWMLENNLTEYYSEQMNKDLHEAASAQHSR